jgi:tRNA modification GTPase
VSGAAAFELTCRQLRSLKAPPQARTAHLDHFIDVQEHFLDEVLVTFFPGPNSYTGENLVEISCHGSPVVAQGIVETFLDRGGRMAEPGEFTLRAVMNGKLDLLQAEAVQDLVESKTSLQAKQAVNQLFGQLSEVLASVRSSLLEIVCQLETGIEFAEEDLSLASPEEILAGLKGVDRELRILEESFQYGRIVHDGIQAVLAGKPNVGKSSIFNILTGIDGAIVTATPGTTRDALKETISLGGIPVTLIDTAGIRREPEHTVEHLGVERSFRSLKDADLALFVLDRSTVYEEEDERIWKKLRKLPYLLLINKNDLPAKLTVPKRVSRDSRARVELSALKGTNVDALRRGLARFGQPGSESQEDRPTMTRIRHKKCIDRARKELGQGISRYAAGEGEEVAIVSLRAALNALGELTGEVTTEDILDQIFSSFCIGK